jgi:hypothetical protein
MTLDFSTPEMKSAWREAQMLLANAAGSGYLLFYVAGSHLPGSKDPLSATDWILAGLGCFCLAMSMTGGRNLFLKIASIHRYLAISRIASVALLALLCGAAVAGVLLWLRASGFHLFAKLDNPTLARVLGMLIIAAVGLLISMALTPVLLNRRSLQ